jgi:hypothetical protein
MQGRKPRMLAQTMLVQGLSLEWKKVKVAQGGIKWDASAQEKQVPRN